MKYKICDLTKDYALYEVKNKKCSNQLIVMYDEKEIYVEYPISEKEDKFIAFTQILHKFEKFIRTEMQIGQAFMQNCYLLMLIVQMPI